MAASASRSAWVTIVRSSLTCTARFACAKYGLITSPLFSVRVWMNSVNSFICIKDVLLAIKPRKKRCVPFEEFSCSEALAKDLRSRRHERFKPKGDGSKLSDRLTKELAQLLVLALFLHLPRFCSVNALVKRRHYRPQSAQGVVKPEIIHCVMKSGGSFGNFAGLDCVAS